MELEMPLQFDQKEPLLRGESIPREFSVPPSGSSRSYIPSAQTQLILNRIAVTPRDYPPLPSRMTPRMAPPPSYYDYNDCGYGGYGYFDPRPMGPRMSRYDAYIDDDYEAAASYAPRYNRATRLADAIVDAEKEKSLRRSPVRTTTTTTYSMPAFTHTRNVSDRILQDEMDKMRIRLKGLSYSLDPNGPVPEIVIPERAHRATSLEAAKRYTSGPKHLACVEYAGGVPQWKRKARASARYPIEDSEGLSNVYRDEYEENLHAAAKDPERLILKDRLSMKIHNFLGDSMEPDKYERYLKTYRNPGLQPKDAQWREEYYKPKPYKASEGVSNTYTSKYPTTSITGSLSKWEKPDTIYSSVDKSKSSTGDDDDKKEKRKKKKSKERDVLSAETTSAIASGSAFGSDPTCDPADDPDMDDKEKKRLEKKKRKAEREAAATAAMEAELAALVAAEAELAMLEGGDVKPEEAAPVVAESEPIAEPEPEPEPIIEALAAEPEPEASEEKCEFVDDVPEEVIPESCPTDESQPPFPVVNDSIVDVQEEDTLNDTIDAQPEQEYTETTNVPLDIPIECVEPLEDPVESEQILVDDPINAEPEYEPINDQTDLSSDRIEDIADTTEQVDEPVVEAGLELGDQIDPEPEVQEPIIDQSTVEEVNALPQEAEEESYVEPPKKAFKADTDFDWGDFDTVDTVDPVDTEAQQRVNAAIRIIKVALKQPDQHPKDGTEGGSGESGGAGECIGVEDNEVAASDDIFDFSDAPQ